MSPKVDWFRGVEAQNGDSTGPPLPKFESAAEMLKTPMIFPKEIVRGVLHQASKLALGGASKSYKTYLLIDLALAVATGQEWLGFETTPCRVLYVNLEIQRPFFTRRLAKICAKRNIRLKPDALDIWNLRGFEISILEIKEKLLGWVEPGDYGLIIIDPIYKAFVGQDENSTGEIKRVLNTLERIAFELDAAVAWAAHFSKGNQSEKEAIDRISGSGVWGRDPDSIVTFTRHEQDDCFIVQMAFRNFPPANDFTVRFDDGLIIPDTHLDPTKFRKKGYAGPSRAELLTEALGGLELTTKEFQKLAYEELGMSRATFFRQRKLAEKLGLIHYDKVSDIWAKK